MCVLKEDYVCTAAPRRADFDQLLPAFLTGDAQARNALPRAAKNYLLTVARQYGADLPEDLLGEVVNQGFLKLLALGPGDFDPEVRKAGTFMGLVVRDAIRQIRAAYAAPGQPKRNRKRRAHDQSDEPSTVADLISDHEHVGATDEIAVDTVAVDGIVEPLTTIVSAETAEDGPVAATAFTEECADPTDTIGLIEIRLDLRNALRRAPHAVASGLTRQYFYGEGLGEIAEAMGLSRFALNRQINHFMHEMQAIS